MINRIIFNVFAWLMVLFFFFVIPVIIAKDPYLAKESRVLAVLAITCSAFIFIQVWMLIGALSWLAASGFYGLEKFLPSNPRRDTTSKALLHRLLYLPAIRSSGSRVISSMLMSYFLTVYAFGAAYIFISILDQDAFSTGHNLSFVDGLYFSVVTAATVGYGDIVPKSDSAKIAVMLEIGISLLYVVFLFSIASSYVRERSTQRAERADARARDHDASH